MEKNQDSSHAIVAKSQKKQPRSFVTLLTGLRLIALSGVSLIFLIACSSPPQSEPAIHNVVYELTGPEAATVNITLRNAGGATEEKQEVGLPWTMAFDAPAGQLAYVSGQLTTSGNQIKCIITIDGRRVQEVVSTGADSIATCNARVQ